MIKYVPVHQATCDSCNQTIMQSNVTQAQFLIFVRSLKWTVGNVVLCPLCQVQKQTKTKKQQYEQLELDLNN